MLDDYSVIQVWNEYDYEACYIDTYAEVMRVLVEISPRACRARLRGTDSVRTASCRSNRYPHNHQLSITRDAVVLATHTKVNLTLCKRKLLPEMTSTREYYSGFVYLNMPEGCLGVSHSYIGRVTVFVRWCEGKPVHREIRPVR